MTKILTKEDEKMSKLSKEDEKEILESFKEIEQPEEPKEKKVTKDPSGKFKYTAYAKNFNPSELTEEKIKELVNKEFPLFSKDEEKTEKEKKERSHARSKLKSALKTRAEEAGQVKEKVVEIKEVSKKEDDEKEKLIGSILDLQGKFPGENDLQQEQLQEMTIDELRQYLAEISQNAIQIVNSGSAEFMFTLLLLGSQTVQSLSPGYGYSMDGLYQKHIDRKEELVSVLNEVLQENPEIATFFSPKNRLFLTIAGIYGTTAFENNMKRQ